VVAAGLRTDYGHVRQYRKPHWNVRQRASTVGGRFAISLDVSAVRGKGQMATGNAAISLAVLREPCPHETARPFASQKIARGATRIGGRPPTWMPRCPESVESGERPGSGPGISSAPSNGFGRRRGTGRPGRAPGQIGRDGRRQDADRFGDRRFHVWPAPHSGRLLYPGVR
jgi:hypothetical protein